MNNVRNKGVLTRSFGQFDAKAGYAEQAHDVTIAVDAVGGFIVTQATSDPLAAYIKQRRLDLGGGSSNLNVFCDELFEDIARYVDTYAQRGGYPANHHSTFTVKDECDAVVAVLKLSSDVVLQKRDAGKKQGPLWRGFGVQ
tara:strand:+ start:120432 stop:120854 length:423 start_codon:yes stop_codon:yes gene_type:complete